LIAGVEARFDEVRAAHPEWEGRSAVVATYGEDGQFSAFASEDPRARFFTSLGFQVPAEIDQLAGDQFYTEISRERADLLDADLLVWDQLSYTPGGRATVETNPIDYAAAVEPDGYQMWHLVRFRRLAMLVRRRRVSHGCDREDDVGRLARPNGL
jgi:hypothetical protein